MPNSESEKGVRKGTLADQVEHLKPSDQKSDRNGNGASKFSPAYWKPRVFKPTFKEGGVTCTASHWYCQIQSSGRREKVGLATNDREEAARTAARLYKAIVAKGWDLALKEVLPGQAARQEAKLPTIGELITKVKASGVVANSGTLYNYVYGIRWLAERAFNLVCDDSKYDYKHGGNERWRERIDRIRLHRFTKERILGGINRYLARHKENPLKLKAAQRSAKSYVRNASCLFQKPILHAIGMADLVNPFAEVKVEAERAPRYNSKIDARTLLLQARKDLKKDPEAYVAVLLALGSGLRRREIDNLRWCQIDFTKGRIRVEVTETFEGKSEDSHGFVFVDTGLLRELRRHRNGAASEAFVLEPDRPAVQRSHGADYRAERTFKRVMEWLRSDKVGVTDQKPLHTLRKEFGSMIYEQADIHTASLQLRHADISTTAAHYLDNRRHVTVGIGAMLKAKKGDK